jgi:hypothetical protein
MKIFLHTRKPGEPDWENNTIEFPQIPSVGEFVVPSGGAALFEVRFVSHTPFGDEMDAEVYAVGVDNNMVLLEKTRD